ncbi:hypothetical protein B0H14DRAFT_2969714 [Mycena olivaceomarginata]|nr:hypothetical protein B0H14DRAFT_2969714 [Mycena olivaceomarginata]
MYSRLASREEFHRGHPRPHRDVQVPPRLLRHLRRDCCPFHDVPWLEARQRHQPRAHAVQHLACTAPERLRLSESDRSGKHRAGVSLPLQLGRVPEDERHADSASRFARWRGQSCPSTMELQVVETHGPSLSLLPSHRSLRHTRIRTSLSSGRGIYPSPSAAPPASPAPAHTALSFASFICSTTSVTPPSLPRRGSFRAL